MTEYAERPIDSDELCNHYARHVSAMTAEDLHSKSDIAAELAWRDARIARLEGKLAAIGRLCPTDYDDREQLLSALLKILRGKNEGGEG